MTDTNTAAAASATAPAATPNIEIVPVVPIAPTVTPELTVESARHRRNEILSNKELCSKVMSGDQDLRAELHKLNSVISSEDLGSSIQSALNGAEQGEWSNVTYPGVLAKHEYTAAARQLGPALGEEHLKMFASGTATVTEAAWAEAMQMKKIIMSDAEWIRNYRSGSEAHKTQMLKINAILGCRIAAPGTETMKVTSPLSSKGK